MGLRNLCLLRPTRTKLLLAAAIASVSLLSTLSGETAASLFFVLVELSFDDNGEGTASDPEEWREVFEAAEAVEPHVDEMAELVESMERAQSGGFFHGLERAAALGRIVTLTTHVALSYLVACLALSWRRPPDS